MYGCRDSSTVPLQQRRVRIVQVLIVVWVWVWVCSESIVLCMGAEVVVQYFYSSVEYG